MITKDNGEVSAVIVAAGSGRRMGGVSKPEIIIRGKTLLARVLEVFYGMPEITRIIVVCSGDNRARLESAAAQAGIALRGVRRSSGSGAGHSRVGPSGGGTARCGSHLRKGWADFRKPLCSLR